MPAKNHCTGNVRVFVIRGIEVALWIRKKTCHCRLRENPHWVASRCGLPSTVPWTNDWISTLVEIASCVESAQAWPGHPATIAALENERRLQQSSEQTGDERPAPEDGAANQSEASLDPEGFVSSWYSDLPNTRSPHIPLAPVITALLTTLRLDISLLHII